MRVYVLVCMGVYVWGYVLVRMNLYMCKCACMCMGGCVSMLVAGIQLLIFKWANPGLFMYDPVT